MNLPRQLGKKAYKTKQLAEKARLKYPERRRKEIGPGVVRFNAGSADQLKGPFQTLTVDIGLGQGKASGQVASSRHVWTFSLTGGPFPISTGLGGDINYSATTTKAAGTNHCP